MNTIRPAILIMPFLSPEALPARSSRSKVIVIPPHGHSMTGVGPNTFAGSGRKNKALYQSNNDD